MGILTKQQIRKYSKLNKKKTMKRYSKKRVSRKMSGGANANVVASIVERVEKMGKQLTPSVKVNDIGDATTVTLPGLTKPPLPTAPLVPSTVKIPEDIAPVTVKPVSSGIDPVTGRSLLRIKSDAIEAHAKRVEERTKRGIKPAVGIKLKKPFR